jgi:hypothetical protein
MKLLVSSLSLEMEYRWDETDRENQSIRGRTCPSATLSTTNPTLTDPGSNPGLRGERPATNRLSHDTAIFIFIDELLLQDRFWRHKTYNGRET